MPFDPDAYLASKAGGGFDPDAYLASRVSPQRVEQSQDRNGWTKIVDQPRPEVSTGAALGRGLAQGVTFGFADELAGAVESVFTDKTYKQARDESRAAFKAAQEAHPYAYGAAEIGGGIATSLIPVGGLARGAGLAAKGVRALAAAPVALKAGAAGALSGLGASEAEDVSALLRDAATSGVVSGVTGAAVSRLVGGASKRVLGRTAKDIVEGESTAKLSIAKKFGERAGGEELAALDDALKSAPALRRKLATSAASSPEKAGKAVAKRMDEISSKLDPIYEAIDQAGGVDVGSVAKRLAKATADMKTAGNATMHTAALNVEKKFEAMFGDQATASARAIRNFANDVGQTAFAGDPLVAAPLKARAQKMLYRELAGAIEEAAGRAKDVSVAELKKLNGEMSMWIPAKAALVERAAKEATGRSSLAEKLGSKILSPALAGGGFALGGPSGLVAGLVAPTALKAGRGVARQADYAIARLAEMAAAGSTPAQLGKAALEMGLSRNVGEGMAQWAARRREAEATSADAGTEP